MDRPFGKHFATRSVVMAEHGMVATSQPLATAVGVEILRAGGSAVDAAIAANAMLGLVEPTGCGIGGDLFAIVWDSASGRLVGRNGSGRSPHALSLEYLRALGLTTIPVDGPLSVSVPGAVDAWFALHAQFGTLPMPELLAPASAYAREGFPVTEIIAGYWAEDAERCRAHAGFAEVFLPGGRAPAPGETFKNPRLADAYALLAAHGRSVFYEGEIAAEIEKAVRAAGGFVTRADLALHESDVVAPVSASYRGYDVWELPPNGQGIVVLQMLNLLEGYDLASLGFGSAEHLHLLVEAKKLAFEDRARYYADPKFAKIPVAGLVSKKYAAARRALIRRDRASDAPKHGDPPALAGGDTVYLATADAAGNMVSLIQSNYLGFGSGVTVPSFGFGLHSRGGSFALDPAHANCYAPGKRPFHTIIPGFLTRAGKPVMAFGVMGAAMQPQGQVQVLTNLIDFGMNVQEAGDAPRVRHEGSSEPTGLAAQGGGSVYLESQFAESAVAGLRKLGHTVERARAGFGGYQAILYDERQRVYKGASESRKDGCAAGY
ncbi:MAG TPA: gamma-glutamyltransferase [Gammaproteobacteria bacterium]|jgi:gamma-glutamyltranspeptidase/glutathione hydrolase